MWLLFFCRFWKEMGLILFHQNLNGLWMQMQCTSLRLEVVSFSASLNLWNLVVEF